MAKKTIKAECITVHNAKDRVSISFAVAPETQAPTVAGQPAQRVSRTVVQINSTDAKQIADLKFLEAGKVYSVTVE